MTNTQLIESFIQYITKIRNYTEATKNRCAIVCNQWSTFIQNLGIDTLKTAEAQQVLKWIQKRKNHDKVCDRTIETELCTIRNLHDYILTFHAPASNPCGYLPEFICKPPQQQDYVSVDEIFNMLESLDTSNMIAFRNYVIIALLWSTGLRNSELRALKWEDIDLEDGRLLVQKGKGNKQRSLFLNDRILNDLKEYRQNIVAGEKTHVFCTYPNSKRTGVCDVPLSNKQLLDILKHTARDVGITRRITAQMLRHSFATHLYEAGVAIEDIREMMGHSYRTETTTYIHVTFNKAQMLLSQHSNHDMQY